MRFWDHATQRYLALVRLRQAWCRVDRDRAVDQRRPGRELDELRRKLMFDEGYDGPRGFDPTKARTGR